VAAGPHLVTGGEVPPTGKKALSRELADFLIEFSIALHKHAMYPEGHPSLIPAAGAVAQRAGLLLDKRERLSLGVARQQLVIEGIATDPKHPVLRDLAGRMHRHHVGAVTFYRGVDFPEITELLHAMSVEPETEEQALGLSERDLSSTWPHLRLHRLAYGQLELVDLDEPREDEEAQEGSASRSAELWVGLARAALAIQEADAELPTTEPAEVARAIEKHKGGAAYDQVIVGYLLQIAEELKAAGGADAMALRRRVSKLVGSLDPDTLERLVDMGGDFTQRKKFVLDATHGMAVDAVMDVVQAAATTSSKTVSHSLVRLLSKLASHAEHGASGVRPHADRALREQVRQLITTWELEDPNPSEYGAALERLSKTGPLFAVASLPAEHAEPLRMLQMCLEIDGTGYQLDRAVDTLLADDRIGHLLDLLEEAQDRGNAVDAIWRRVATVEQLEAVLDREPVDQSVLERLVPRMGLAAGPPMLDALARAESQATRRRLLSLLAGLGPGRRSSHSFPNCPRGFRPLSSAAIPSRVSGANHSGCNSESRRSALTRSVRRSPIPTNVCFGSASAQCRSTVLPPRSPFSLRAPTIEILPQTCASWPSERSERCARPSRSKRCSAWPSAAGRCSAGCGSRPSRRSSSRRSPHSVAAGKPMPGRRPCFAAHKGRATTRSAPPPAPRQHDERSRPLSERDRAGARQAAPLRRETPGPTTRHRRGVSGAL
jgi:hypothetical protein